MSSITVMILKCFTLVVLCACFSNWTHASNNIDIYKAIFTEYPKHVPNERAIDAPITGNGDVGLTMAPSEGKIEFYVGKNDFWKAVASKPDGTIALPGGLTLTSELFQEKWYYAEQLPGSAELIATLKNTKQSLKINAWVPATDNKVIIELESTERISIALNLWTPSGAGSAVENGLENESAWVHRSFDNLPYLQWPTYMAMAMNHQNGNITLQPNKRETIVIAIYTNHDSEKWHEKA